MRTAASAAVLFADYDAKMSVCDKKSAEKHEYDKVYPTTRKEVSYEETGFESVSAGLGIYS